MSRASPFTTGNQCAQGCRGFTGPIPPPLWMSVIRLCSNGISVPQLLRLLRMGLPIMIVH